MDHIKSLFSILNSLTPIPADEWGWLASTLEPRRFVKGTLLFSQGVDDKSIHFITKGLVRYFYLTADGVERNHTFAAEHNLAACLNAYAGAGPCPFSIQAIEATETYMIPASSIEAMENRNDCWLRLKLRLMEHVALRKEKREAEFLLESAEARYRGFMERYAALEPRIPQYHIASYLGITAVALSRIRKRLKN